MSTPSTIWLIEVWPAGAAPAPAHPVRTALYLVQADWTLAQATRAAGELFADPVCEAFRVQGPGGAAAGRPAPAAAARFEVHLLPGVMDPAAASAELALRDMGLPAAGVRTAKATLFAAPPSAAERAELFNPAVEHLVEGTLGCAPPPVPPEYAFQVRHAALRELDDAGLLALSKQAHLFLDLREMQAIQAHYRALGREPTDAELETLAQTWSEHCVHKTLKAEVTLAGGAASSAGGPKIPGHYRNLIKETIFAATQKLDRPWCLSVFKDNAGVIEFDDEWAVCFKVETHNRPSAIEPYGGAATGVGGVIRDVLGTGLGAKPIANTDVFCFAPPHHDGPAGAGQLPPGVLPPQRVMAGVVAGVRDYGNRMGIPTVNGAIYFEPRYLANPLVFCGCVGLLPRNKVDKQVHPGDRIVVAGGRTGRDGIHGATFSSGEIEHTTATTFGGAVQIGNAITEKKTMDVLLAARDAGPGGSALYSAITDCGAGGLSSAIGEMGNEIGAEVVLDRVPLKYAGLRYDEIWISEAQERMVLAVPPEHVQRLIAMFAAEDVEATEIGVFGLNLRGRDGQERPGIRLRYHDQVVAELDCHFLHDGCPRRHIQAAWTPPAAPAAPSPHAGDVRARLLAELADPNVASKAAVWRMYDHEVQGGTVIKPYACPAGSTAYAGGPTDAAVLRPLAHSPRGVVISNGLAPHLSDHDPYWMAYAAIDEAIRNAVCVGADPDRLAILDNFCWGNCTKPDRMAALVRACQACHDAALVYGTPFISGKDSLNNEYNGPGGLNITIPGTLLVSAMSVVADVARCLTPVLTVGDPLYLVGQPSRWPFQPVAAAGDLPLFDPQLAARTHRGLAALIGSGVIRAAHDVSDGGLLVAVAEMLLASAGSAIFAGHAALTGQADDRLPAGFTKPAAPLSLDQACFTAWPACYVVQVSDTPRFVEQATALGLPYVGIGMAVPADPEPVLLMRSGYSESRTQSHWRVADLRAAWAGTFPAAQ